MGNGLLFFGLVLVLAIFVVVASQTMPTKEGFQPLVIPTPGPPAQPIIGAYWTDVRCYITPLPGSCT